MLSMFQRFLLLQGTVPFNFTIFIWKAYRDSDHWFIVTWPCIESLKFWIKLNPDQTIIVIQLSVRYGHTEDSGSLRWWSALFSLMFAYQKISKLILIDANHVAFSWVHTPETSHVNQHGGSWRRRSQLHYIIEVCPQ